MPTTIFRQILLLTAMVLLTVGLGVSVNAALKTPETPAKLTYQESPQVRQQQKLKRLATGLKLLSSQQLLNAARILGSATGTERLLAQQIVIVQGKDLRQRQRYRVYNEHSRLADDVLLRQVAELCLLPGLLPGLSSDQFADERLDANEQATDTGQARLIRATQEVRAGYIVLPAESAESAKSVDGC